MAPHAASAGRARQENYLEEVGRGVREVIAHLYERLEETHTPPPNPQDLVDLIEAALPFPLPELDPYFADVGPFYDTAGAQTQLGGVSKQAIDDRRKKGAILAMKTGQGRWVYPAWQFTGDGRIHAALRPTLLALREVPGWAAGVWLVNPCPALNGRTPRAALSAGEDPGVVAAAAAHDAALVTR